MVGAASLLPGVLRYKSATQGCPIKAPKAGITTPL
jgi:hypothetical protein